MRRLRIFLAFIGPGVVTYPLISPPLGLLYLAGYVRSKYDVDITIVDNHIDLLSMPALAKRIMDSRADIVGFSCLTPGSFALPEVTRLVRAGLPDALIVLGGAHATTFGAAALEATAADALVVGEGELIFEQIVRSRIEGGSLADVSGLIWRNGIDAPVTINPGESPVLEDLDSLPFPAYDLIDPSAYWSRLSFTSHIPRRRYVALFTSRGCPYRCVYCHRVFGKRFRAHSAERIVAEIEHYQKAFGITHLDFVDDIFNFDANRILAFSDLVNRRNVRVRISLPNALRCDLLTQEMVDALADAGVHYSAMALETGSPRIQRMIGKNLNIERFLKGTEMMVNRRVFTYGFAMMGFPTETEEDLKQTIDVAANSKLHVISFFTVTPFPNTALYELARREHPEKLARLRYDGMEYVALPANFSAVSDDVFFSYQRKAYTRFFLNAPRVLRILRDHPCRRSLVMHAPYVVKRILMRKKATTG